MTKADIGRIVAAAWSACRRLEEVKRRRELWHRQQQKGAVKNDTGVSNKANGHRPPKERRECGSLPKPLVRKPGYKRQ
jgi:hypothetical protein